MKKGFRIIKFKKNKPIFELKDISKSFDGRPILKKISMEMYPGEIVGLLGPNGSGKSTLYNIIIGQHMADKGKIVINNKDISEIPIHERTNLGLGYAKASGDGLDYNVGISDADTGTVLSAGLTNWLGNIGIGAGIAADDNDTAYSLNLIYKF